LFNNLNIKSPIALNADLDGAQTIDLKIKAVIGNKRLQPENGIPLSENMPAEIIIQNNELSGLLYEFKDSDGKPKKFQYSFSRRIIPSMGEVEILAWYWNERNKYSAITAINDLITNKSEEDVLAVLKHINPQIQTVKIGINNSIYLDIKDKQSLLPINVMGDGIIKIISLLSALRFAKDGILLIDEIENGLHFSSLQLLWEAVLKAASLYNVQIFATTHSYECVNSFYSSYNKLDEKNDNISLIRLENQSDEIKAVSYSAADIKTALDNQWEVR
jgi:AAA15 family ATPase/GTPase